MDDCYLFRFALVMQLLLLEASMHAISRMHDVEVTALHCRALLLQS